MHTDRRKVICEYSRLSAAGDWERYAAEIPSAIAPRYKVELTQETQHS